MRAPAEISGSRVRRIGDTADAIAAARKPKGVNWALMLTLLLRLCALIWLARGVYNWAVIIGLPEAGRDFAALPPEGQALTVASAVLECVAGVGLWLTGFWGVVIWLALIAADFAVLFLAPALSPGGLNAALGGAGLAALYILLRLFAYRQEAKRRAR